MATFEETIEKAVQAAVKRALLDAHPVGSIYLTIKDENPSTKFGGTWEKLPASVCLQTADTTHGAGTIDASRSSAIYGKSTTVQPPAYALIAWRRTA